MVSFKKDLKLVKLKINKLKTVKLIDGPVSKKVYKSSFQVNGRPRVLLLNHTSIKCGVYQFGKRVYELSARSKKVDYFYKDVGNHEQYVRALAEIKPHFIIYNWHYDRMPWLRDADITGNKAMMHYFIYHDGSMMKVYDKYLFFGGFDPQNKDAIDRRVMLPRPLFEYTGDYPVNKVPTIGSFGFAFNHKRFAELVTLVNGQFDEATINIHMTLPFFGNSGDSHIDRIAAACRKNNVKKGIRLNITQDFCNDEQLLRFLAGNDINVFNYAMMTNPGLSSAPDYALSVKRPIAITNNMMFRHITSDDITLEKNSIKSILDKGTAILDEYYDKWSLDNFTSSMENLFLPAPQVLFLNHKITNCGVYQFGKRLYEQAVTSNKVDYTYKEVDSVDEISQALKNAPEHIIFNWHRATMPLLTEEMILNNNSKHYFIFHEEIIRKNYDKYLFFGDYDIGNKKIPLHKSALLPRPLFNYSGVYPTNKVFTVGSFGFGFWNKGFDKLVKRVNAEFQEAVINLHIPFSHFGDPDKSQTAAVIRECQRLNINPKIRLNITQNFLTNQEILTFLAGNDINLFLYSDNGEGISSAVDYALSVKRPMMVTDCQMFRHFKNDEILAEKNTIMDVYNRGLKPLEKVRMNWAKDRLVAELDKEFDKSKNKILSDTDRAELTPLISDMFLKCPEMMARKYPPANVQQAFILDQILKLNPPKDVPILCVGCADDTAAEYLKVAGYQVIGIDPIINFSLAEYKKIASYKFDIIFSCSVIEHVQDDEQFVRDICELLNDGGCAILTCDFREEAGKVHPLDFRFYKKHDLLVRLGDIIKSYNCRLVDEANWDAKPNFHYEGYDYSFATWMFSKNL